MTSLFKLGDFVAHSGQTLHYKVECDALTDDDWRALAWILAQRLPAFARVVGIPTGGERLADPLRSYATDNANRIIVADDVLTTGGSMGKMRAELLRVEPGCVSGRVDVVGAVAFARALPPAWIRAAWIIGDAS